MSQSNRPDYSTPALRDWLLGASPIAPADAPADSAEALDAFARAEPLAFVYVFSSQLPRGDDPHAAFAREWITATARACTNSPARSLALISQNPAASFKTLIASIPVAGSQEAKLWNALITAAAAEWRRIEGQPLSQADKIVLAITVMYTSHLSNDPDVELPRSWTDAGITRQLLDSFRKQFVSGGWPRIPLGDAQAEGLIHEGGLVGARRSALATDVHDFLVRAGWLLTADQKRSREQLQQARGAATDPIVRLSLELLCEGGPIADSLLNQLGLPSERAHSLPRGTYLRAWKSLAASTAEARHRLSERLLAELQNLPRIDGTNQLLAVLVCLSFFGVPVRGRQIVSDRLFGEAVAAWDGPNWDFFLVDHGTALSSEALEDLVPVELPSADRWNDALAAARRKLEHEANQRRVAAQTQREVADRAASEELRNRFLRIADLPEGLAEVFVGWERETINISSTAERAFRRVTEERIPPHLLNVAEELTLLAEWCRVDARNPHATREFQTALQRRVSEFVRALGGDHSSINEAAVADRLRQELLKGAVPDGMAGAVLRNDKSWAAPPETVESPVVGGLDTIGASSARARAITLTLAIVILLILFAGPFLGSSGRHPIPIAVAPPVASSLLDEFGLTPGPEGVRHRSSLIDDATYARLGASYPHAPVGAPARVSALEAAAWCGRLDLLYQAGVRDGQIPASSDLTIRLPRRDELVQLSLAESEWAVDDSGNSFILVAPNSTAANAVGGLQLAAFRPVLARRIGPQ